MKSYMKPSTTATTNAIRSTTATTPIITSKQHEPWCHLDERNRNNVHCISKWCHDIEIGNCNLGLLPIQLPVDEMYYCNYLQKLADVIKVEHRKSLANLSGVGTGRM